MRAGCGLHLTTPSEYTGVRVIVVEFVFIITEIERISIWYDIAGRVLGYLA